MTAEAPPVATVDAKSKDTTPSTGLRAWLSRHPLAAYAIRRFGLYLVELWGALTIAFFFFRLIPGDPINTLIQTLQQNYVYNAQASQEVISRYQHEFGLDGNIFSQYLKYMSNLVLHGDLGPSLIQYPTPAQDVILQSLPWTIGLLGISAVLAWILGIIIGAIAGWRRGKLGSTIVTNLSIALAHVPFFFVALILVYVFAYSMGVLPARSAYDSNLS
ncbi:MAG TPA: ABC transporter permease, partial [Kribbella sp.]